ncbi:unnamed protein product [Pelagomonas calceolata]|uniref:Uncharacterized protein n=2 Tax=Pelagomonas calceolata TaxID=35677 RepID=A0A8J2WWK4_9STRA|nr:unnamed protein product [Pelagomonas calceolata]
MGKSAWYQVDTSRVYAASPAPPKEPVPDGDEWLDDYKPKDWQQQNDELDEQMRTIDVGDGLAQWDLDDEALNAVESLGKGPASFVIPRNVDLNPHHLEYRVATHRYREARARGWLTKTIPEVVDEEDQRELDEAKQRRTEFKNKVRATIAVQDAMTGDREHGVLLKDRENALRVASIIEMLRADDEGLEEVQNLPQLQNDKKFETRLVDERGRRRYAPRFSKYPPPALGPSNMWWPWGCPHTQDAGALMNRAQLLKEHYRSQPDPRGEALEVGVAFAEAAAAAHREANRRLVGNVEGECPEDELVAHLEKEARDFLRMACGKSDVKQVLRRACSISACREIVRKRTFTRPEKIRDQVLVARKLHARECAAERRRQRKRRQCAHLALLRDSLRQKGRPGRTTSSATGPDVKSGVKHYTELMTLFALNDDDDRTVSEDEDDYEAMITEFAGDPARGVTPALSEEDEERLAHEAKFVSKEVIDARVKAGLLFDRSHAKNQSTVAIDGLTISCRRERASAPPSVKSEGAVAATLATSSSLVTTPSQKRRVVEVSSIRSTQTPQKPPPLTATQKVLATIEELPAIPTVEELRQDRDTLLALFHALFFVRGVRHLDSDLTDPDWYPGSAAHLNGASLGGFADCHREVMEEYVPIRAREHAASPSDDDDYAELLASLGTLRAKAKDATGAAEMFLRAATERDRRRDARSARASELKEAERVYEEALNKRDAIRAEADAKTVSFDGPARTPRTRADDQKRAEALRKSIEEADAAVEAAHERCMRAAAAVQSDARARDIVPPKTPITKRRPSATGSRRASSASTTRRPSTETMTPGKQTPGGERRSARTSLASEKTPGGDRRASIGSARGARASAERRTSFGSARTTYRRNSARRRPRSKAEFAPPSGSYQLPGAGIRSKYHRLDRDLRANAPKAQHVDTYTTQIPIDPHDHESAPWQEMPLRPQDMTADLANETILFRISEPWPQNENLNDLTAMRGRPALEPATYLRGGTLLDDPTPYAYSAIRSAQPLGMRSQHEAPHLAATAPRPSAPRIKPRQLKSGRATSELMEPEFTYRPTQSILTKIDVRKKYEFPSQYDPILGLGAPETFDHPNISYHDTRCRSKLEELEIADPSRRAALALHGRDVEEYDQDLVPEADREARELDRTNTRWAPSYGKD